MQSNEELVRNFSNGAQRGQSNRMSILRGNNGETFLIDYGWAVIGERLKNGKVIAYTGWKGYSSTTSRHVNIVKRYADKEENTRPEIKGM